ncbi:MAG: hypothetical protein V1749_11275 [Candidatus Desantisbacteria bacterium]
MPVFSPSLAIGGPEIPRLKKALRRLQMGTAEESIGATGFLIKELSKQPISPEVQEVMKQLINRLIRDSHSMCSSVREKSISELGKLINELVKSKDLEGLRYVARSSTSPDTRNRAMKELVRFEDIKGLRYISQWGRYKEIRNRSVDELAKLKDIEGLRYVAQWNMYKDTANRAIKELENLIERLVRFKDRDGLKCLINTSRNKDAKKKAIEGLEKLLDDLVRAKDIDSLRYVAGLGTNRNRRARAIEEINDVKSLKYVIRCTKNVFRDTCLKAVEELGKFIDDITKTKDRESLEYLAEFSTDEIVWKRSIEELHRIREISHDDRVAESLQKILLPRGTT